MTADASAGSADGSAGTLVPGRVNQCIVVEQAHYSGPLSEYIILVSRENMHGRSESL